MLVTMFNKGSLPLLEKSAYFTYKRNEVIANNIANADTPFYKAIDLPEKDFRTMLQRAIDRKNDRVVKFFTFNDTSYIKHLPNKDFKIKNVLSKDVGILKHDENNVSIELEMTKLAKNTMMHTLLMSFIDNEFDKIATAIRERIQA